MENNQEKDTTNWKAWYWALVIFLVVQIILYFIITNRYAA